jgi:hypothetical protein
MGAFLEFGRRTIVPKNFKLILPEHSFEAHCDVRHKTKTGVGVLFMSNRREASAHFASPFNGSSDVGSVDRNGS